MVFECAVNSRGTRLSSFLTFPVCFRCQMIIEWPTLSSLAASCVVVRGSASGMAFNWSLSTPGGWPLHFSFLTLLSPLQSFLNHHYAAHSLSVPGPNALLMVWVVSAASWFILNSNKKIAQICFLPNIISLLLSHFSCVWLRATPEMEAHQALPSLGFFRQEHWSGLPFPSPMHESEKWKQSRSVVSDS